MRVVARYFFNVVDGKLLADEDGTECSGMDDVRAKTIEFAGAMIRDLGGQLPHKGEWQMHVTDSSKTTVYKLRFSEETV
jgi:hypothetical protein